MTQSAVEAGRERWHVQINVALQELFEVGQNLLGEASGDLHAPLTSSSARLNEESPQLSPLSLAALRYDFNPEVGWNEPWVSRLRTRAPARVAGRWVSVYLQPEVGGWSTRRSSRRRDVGQESRRPARPRTRLENGDNPPADRDTTPASLRCLVTVVAG
jgi:hypothetical protein